MSGSDTEENSDRYSRWKVALLRAGNAILVPVLAVFTALVIGALVILWAGGNPIAAYIGLFQGGFGSLRALSETAVWATPYIFAGLAVALAFKGGLFNIGAEGQLALGATALPGLAILPDMLGVQSWIDPPVFSGGWRWRLVLLGRLA
jgi:simple sugar transport system permease protein